MSTQTPIADSKPASIAFPVAEFFSGVGLVLSLELRQRVRGTAWYVLLGIFVVLVAIVTGVLTFSLAGLSNDNSFDAGGIIYSVIIYFVLLLGTLVAPALSGTAINGDRDAGTLATTQVTLITTWQLVLGKFFAAWITALAFLVASLPFIVFSSFIGGLDPVIVLVSAVVLAFELGVVAAIGVGLSGVVTRSLFSIVLSYLLVALLSVGTLIVFALGGLALQTDQTSSYTTASEYTDQGVPINCTEPVEYTSRVPRFDLFWGVLVANPYVLLADSVPTTFDSNGNAVDLFGQIKTGVRSAQISPGTTVVDECAPNYSYPTAEETINSTVPGWFVGVLIHLALAVGALFWAHARTDTPAGRLPRGSRVA
jgi:ABC-2 type transport system permease protein